MPMARTLTVALAGFLVLACSPGTALLEDPQADRGAELLAPFKKELKAALTLGMQGGVTNAISVCKDQAPALAAAFSVDGVVMGRSSHRLRNPANNAPSWVNDIVDDYLGSDSARQPATVALEGGRLGYVEPILIQPVCLACHGETLAPEVATTIAEEYPEDRATGFSVGDLRGVFWVEYPGVTEVSLGIDTGG